jgi:peptidase C25-like protein
MYAMFRKKIIFAFLIFFLFSSSILINSKIDMNEIKPNIFLPDIKELEIHYPPGYSLGSFDTYIQSKPYSPTYFTSISNQYESTVNSQSISILIDSAIYKDQIITDIDQYIQDLDDEGFTISSMSKISGGNPDEIKQWIKNQYNLGSTGFVFIGDVPVAWAEVSESQFPCDLFYMDLDGSWIDTNQDGIYDTHSSGIGDMGPEVYVGRLYASTLHWADEKEMLSDYFDKIHRYRTGELTQPWKGLEYIEEDWYNMDVYLNMVYNGNISHHDYGYRTTAEDYLEKLEEGQHFVQVCAHSFPGGHHFGRRPTEAVTYLHTYVYSPIDRSAKILVGSDDGIIVWLNGENILQKDIYMGWFPDRYKVDITLKQGWNSLLCKVSQENGDYQVSVRFTDSDLHSLTDLRFQTNNPEEERNEAPFIRSWLINGFHQDTSERFWEYLTTNYLRVDEASIIPSEGEIMGGKTWTTYHVGYPYIDLDAIEANGDYGADYAFVTINSQENTNCELWVGYDDGMRIWLNGEEIFFDNRYGEFIADMSKIPINLKVGQNHLLLKISDWMDNHGFSSRICTSDGEQVEGLSYNPTSEPLTYIGEWLIAGTFENPNTDTRLNIPYIPNEHLLRPTAGDTYSNGAWEKGIGNGRPFDINSHFDHGGWVFSETIQDVDPPCLFYNLFACGPGRFTDDNYLAGSYIFDTSYGLISVASSKSGSMLSFEDFYEPLGKGKNIGDSFKEWFEAQAPYAQWEKEWFYGMVICGDPTLTVFSSDPPKISIEISNPTNGIYLADSLILPFFNPVIFGNITIKANVMNPGYGIESLTFQLNDDIIFIDTDYPYEYCIDSVLFGKQKISIIAQDSRGQIDEKELFIWKFF